MKKTLIEKIPYVLPTVLESEISCAKIYDSSCSPEASVYLIEGNKFSLFLKRAALGALKNEATMTRYFHSKGHAAEVVNYVCDEKFDWLMTTALDGEDCTHTDYLSEPKRLTDRLAELLRELHSEKFADCPIQNRMDTYFDTVEQGFRTGRCDLSFYESLYGSLAPQSAYELALRGKELLSDKVLLHGDYCLPNIILKDWRLSGFIDLGGGGVGDRHIDLYWGAWTLCYNLRTDRYRERFFDAYGRDKVDAERLRTVAAAEVFG